jgi:hypothetical protein
MTSAKRHHVVPRMLLRRFSSEPGAKNPPLSSLDKASGRPAETSVNNETVIGHYYRMGDSSLPFKPGFAEETLSSIESAAANPIQKLVDGIQLTAMELVSMAFFLHVQRERTPRGRAWHAFADERMHTELLKAKLSDPQLVLDHFRDQGDPRSAEEIEAWRTETLDAFEKGEMGVESGPDREIALIFFLADKVAPALCSGMTWRSLRAPAGSGFICSDNPLNIYDPAAANRAAMHAGVSWFSSIVVEATLPLSTNVCLLLTPGSPGWRIEHVTAARVAEINLRTYASAELFIYGPSQQSVQRVRQHAKQARALVHEFRPRPPLFTIFEAIERDPTPHRVTTHRPPDQAPRRARK